MNTKKVLVSGASGFIASHCIIRLLQKGYEVRGTLRNMDRSENLNRIFQKHAEDLGKLDLVYADLLDAESWNAALEGCQYVLHIASPIILDAPKDPDEMIVPAREGTLNVLRAASKHGIKRVVITSSIDAIRHLKTNNRNHVYTEADWSEPDHPDNTPYSLSKTFAEKAAWNFVDNESMGLELTTIQPGMIFGPALENDFGASLTVIKKLLDGKYPGLPQLGWPIGDVRDIADIHLLAMESPQAAGERFIANNEFIWMQEIAVVLRKHFPDYKRKIPRHTLPNWLIRMVALFDPPTRTVLKDLGKKNELSCEKAKNMLGWKPRTNEEAIISGARSLMELGIV